MLRRVAGFTLVELMISMLLGLVVIGGAISIISANKQNYRTNEALSQVQESARSAFELLARDVREAGASGCDNNGRVANVLEPSVGKWWQDWFVITGYDDAKADPAVSFGTGKGDRVAGTDSMQIRGTQGVGLYIESHDPTSANFKLSEATGAIVPDDILIACDFDHAAIFRVTQYNSSNVTLVHNTGSGDPRNCSKGLGYPTVCGNPGNTYTFGPNAELVKLKAVDWYIGNNDRANEGGRSLFRRRLGSAANVVTEEVVAGVSDMQLSYRVDGTDKFVAAKDVAAADWDKVTSVRIDLFMQSADRRVSTDATVNSGRLNRDFSNVVTLRNRVP